LTTATTPKEFLVGPYLLMVDEKVGETRAIAAARMPNPCLSHPSFPGMLPPLKTYASWPVWRDSTTAEARFQPMSKRQAVRLWHDARRFERQTREPGLVWRFDHGPACGMPARRENEHGSAVGGYRTMAVVAVSGPLGREQCP
jgi:hypothetical protein